MRLWIMSDLHADIYPYDVPAYHPPHDVVIIAGDIREGMSKGVDWIAYQGFTKPVIYVAGNHEFYRHAIDASYDKARAKAAKMSNVHILQNDVIDIQGVRFVGATLWTDYKLKGDGKQALAMHTAQSIMNDHRLIRVAHKDYSKFKPADALREFQQSTAYIRWVLGLPFDGPKVVVTHHGPSIKSTHAGHRHGDDLLNAAYCSHLDELVDKSTLWVHGHTHWNCDYRLGGGRVVANQRGYSDTHRYFDPAFVIDLAQQKTADPEGPAEAESSTARYVEGANW